MPRDFKVQGWLKNAGRRDRRDRPNTMTDGQVLELMEKVDKIQKYSQIKEIDFPMRLRDKALISLAWIFFRRGGENLKVRRQDIQVIEDELSVLFRIQKKIKRHRICHKCNDKNARRANHCKMCGENISSVELTPKVSEREREGTPKTLSKSLKFPSCEHVVKWIEYLDDHKVIGKQYIFSPYIQNRGFDFNKHLTVQRFDQILQRLDDTLTSHIFRYGATEKLFRLKYTPYEVKIAGEWSSTKIPEDYARRKGITVEARKFAEDVRVI